MAPLATTASTSSASVSVMTVAPTVVATAGSAVIPKRCMIGYITSVCDAHSEPMRIDAGRSKPSQRAPTNPNAIGRANVSSPNWIAACRSRANTLRSSSSPARNMR